MTGVLREGDKVQRDSTKGKMLTEQQEKPSEEKADWEAWNKLQERRMKELPKEMPRNKRQSIIGEEWRNLREEGAKKETGGGPNV